MSYLLSKQKWASVAWVFLLLSSFVILLNGIIHDDVTVMQYSFGLLFTTATIFIDLGSAIDRVPGLFQNVAGVLFLTIPIGAAMCFASIIENQLLMWGVGFAITLIILRLGRLAKRRGFKAF